MVLSDNERTYLMDTVNEMMSDLNSVLQLPRITEEEWGERFGELPHPDDDNLYQPLEDTKCVRAILAERDPRLVWSVIQIPGLGLTDDDTDDDSYLIVPGYWQRGAEGWHLTTIRWDPAHLVVGYYKREDDGE
jgi:hypothetical protein